MSNNTLHWDIEEHRYLRGLTTNTIFILLIVNYILGVYFFDIEGRYADLFAFGFSAGIVHFFIQGRETNIYSFLYQLSTRYKVTITTKE